jgi:hypothetical protein
MVMPPSLNQYQKLLAPAETAEQHPTGHVESVPCIFFKAFLSRRHAARRRSRLMSQKLCGLMPEPGMRVPIMIKLL